MTAMTEKLTDMFAACSKEMAASLENQKRAQAKRRERWMSDIEMTRDMFKMECRRRNNMSLTYTVAMHFLDGMGDIAAQRLLALYLPMLQTLQRVELNFAKVPGHALFPQDDIRLYTGNLNRVEYKRARRE
jgi:hypothetical protein